MRISIGCKLGLAIAILLFPFVVLAVFNFHQLGVIETALRQVTETNEPISAAAAELEVNVVETAFAALAYVHGHDPKKLQHIADDKKDFERFIVVLYERADSEPMRSLVARVERQYGEFLDLINAFIVGEDLQTRERGSYVAVSDALDAELAAEVRAESSGDDPIEQTRREVLSAMRALVGVLSSLCMRDSHDLLEIDAAAAFDHAQEAFERTNNQYEGLPLLPPQREQLSNFRTMFARLLETARVVTFSEAEESELMIQFVAKRRELDDLLDDQIQALARGELR